MKYLTLSTLVASLTVGPTAVSAGGASTLSIEPYIADWCAAQFPDQLGNWNGYGLARMIKKRDYVRIEPVLGKYCFEQFPTELKDQLESATLANMAEKHVQAEPYFMEWGDASFAQNLQSEIELEPYVAKWCAYGQFQRLFSNPVSSLNSAENKGYVELERTLARWCFSQFPNELAALNEEETANSMGDDKVIIENFIIKWVAAEYNFLIYQQPTTTGTEKAILGLLITLIFIAVIMAGVICWRRKTAKEVAQFQHDVQLAENSFPAPAPVNDSA